MIISTISPVVYTPPVLFQPGGKQRADDGGDRNDFPDLPQSSKFDRYLEGSDRSTALGVRRSVDQKGTGNPENSRQTIPQDGATGSNGLASPSVAALPTGTSGIVDKNDVTQRGKGGQKLTEEEQKIIDELRRTDERVRAHEQAHQAVAGGLARSKSFSYVTGPDGNRYATGGEVKIDTSAVPGDPDATARKMQKVQRAALAPADPSAQDLAVAASARATESAARIEAARLRNENSQANRRSAESFAPVRPAVPQERTISGTPASRPRPAVTPQRPTNIEDSNAIQAEEQPQSDEQDPLEEFVQQIEQTPTSTEQQRKQVKLERAADARIINTRISFLNDFYTPSSSIPTSGRIINSAA